MKKRFITNLTKMLLLGALLVSFNSISFGQVAGDFKSVATGNWNATTTWQTYDGSSWGAASSTPAASNNVYLQVGFTVTLTQNEACNNLSIHNSNTGARLALGAFNLQVNGKMVNYSSAVDVFPVTPSNTVGSGSITSTAGSGKITFIGTTRTIFATGEWGNNPPGWDVEFAPTAGNTFTIQTGLKARNITVSSGTVISSSADLRPDGGAGGSGTLTVKNGSLLQLTAATVNIKRVGSASATSHFGTLTVEAGGTLEFTGTSVIGASTFALNGTVKYSGAGAQTLAVKGGNSGGADINTYTNLSLAGSGTKTLGIATTVNGTLTMGGTASLALGAFSLTYGAASTLEYAGTAAQTTTLVEFPASGVNNLLINNPNEVIIDASRSIAGGATVNPLSNLTLNAAATLNVAGTFLIASDATGTGSFIENGTLTATTSTAQKYLTDGRWWYVGSPVNSTTALNAFGSLSASPSSGTRLLFRDEVNQVYTVVANADNLAPLKGYTFRSFSAPNLTATFTGVINNGSVGSVGNLTRTNIAGKPGYNLVANPFPSAIDFSSTATGITRTNIYPTIWYKKASGFATFNYDGDIGAGGGQQYIPAMQAFWVQVMPAYTTGTLILGNAARVHNAQSFYKTANTNNVFRINIMSNGISDEAVVYFKDNAQADFENFDSEKMFTDEDNVPQIYTLTTDNIEAVINGFPTLGSSEIRVVPMGFKTDVAGTFTFDATNISEFDASIPVTLEDALTGTMQDLRQNASYSFTSGVANTANRFRLHFGTMATSLQENANSAVTIYAYSNNIYVNTPQNNSVVEVYDMLGNLVYSQLSKSGMNTVTVNFGSGIYMVKVQSNGVVKTEKVVINK